MPACPSSPIATLVRHFDGAGELPPGTERTLLQVLASVPDPRARRGVRHSFAGILVIGICAVASGARSFAAIAEWAADCGRERLHELGIDVPHLSTIRRALCAFTGDGFDAALGGWLADCVQALPGHGGTRRAHAIDGKTLRGARRGSDRAPGVMACIDHATGVVLGQVQISDKDHEIPQFPVLLDQVGDLADAVVTADALHTQRGHADRLRAQGAHFVLTVKGNQCATRRFVHIPATGGTDSKGGLLGPMAYLEPKGEGDQSMPENRWPGPGAWDGAPGGPRGMAKA